MFTVVFYGLGSFCCENTEVRVTLCERDCFRLPSLRDYVQRGENRRKNSALNYKSATLNQLGYAGFLRMPVLFVFVAEPVVRMRED